MKRYIKYVEVISASVEPDMLPVVANVDQNFNSEYESSFFFLVETLRNLFDENKVNSLWKRVKKELDAKVKIF